MNSEGDSTDHISDLSLDLALQGELSETDLLAVHTHVDVCRECRERYETATSDVAHFRRDVLPRTLEHVTRSLGDSAAPRTRSRVRRAVGSALACATVAATAVFLLQRQPIGTETGPTGLLRKGGPELTVFARHEQRVFRVSDGTRLMPGDTLRFQGEPSGATYLMVASIDGANHASVYVPYEGKTSLRIPEDRTFHDDAAIALDGALGPERIFGLFSKQPLDADAVVRALSSIGERGHEAIRANTRLNIPDAYEVSLCIEK